MPRPLLRSGQHFASAPCQLGVDQRELGANRAEVGLDGSALSSGSCWAGCVGAHPSSQSYVRSGPLKIPVFTKSSEGLGRSRPVDRV